MYVLEYFSYVMKFGVIFIYFISYWFCFKEIIVLFISVILEYYFLFNVVEVFMILLYVFIKFLFDLNMGSFCGMIFFFMFIYFY